MPANDNSKDRIKFACKELEAALGNFEAVVKTSVDVDTTSGTVSGGAQLSAREEKIVEIKRQLRDIREQLDSLSQ